MTKIQTVLTSLICVLPAAFLTYLLVMVMLMHSENLTTMAYVFLGGTLIASLVTVLIPAGILVGDRRKPAPEKVIVKGDPSEEVEAIDDDDEEGERMSSGSFDAQDVLSEASDDDIGNSDQDMLMESEADIDTEHVDDFEDFDLEEEEEAPKPKKKKK